MSMVKGHLKSWVEHVREYSNSKKMKYGDAMKSPECKELYHKNKMKSGDVEKVMIKIKPNKDDKPLKAFVPPENVSTEEPKIKTRKPRTKKVIETI